MSASSMQQEILAEAARHNVAKRERDPICEVCGHCHVQGVKCKICGHVGKYIVPGGPNRPNRGAIPPVPPGPMHNPNRTPPTIEGLTVGSFQKALQSFFDVLPQAEAAGQSLPPELSNLDQLRARAARARAYRVWVHRPHTHLSRHRPLPLGAARHASRLPPRGRAAVVRARDRVPAGGVRAGEADARSRSVAACQLESVGVAAGYYDVKCRVRTS